MIRSLNLDELGDRIEAVDELLLTLIAARMSLSLDVGAYKLATGKPIVTPDRENRRIELGKQLGIPLGLNPNFVSAVLYNIIGESCKQQLIQLQGKYDAPPDVGDEEWYGILKQNLLRLTERVAPTYDQLYGSEFFASTAYREYENMLLDEEVGMLNVGGCLVDLGCATGVQTFRLGSHFPEAIGYDMSGAMIAEAQKKQGAATTSIRFKQADLEQEEGIPLHNDSASFVMMNLGTASDMRDIGDLIADVHRVLCKGGRFLFSFYNRNALVYQWQCLPWPVNLAADVNHLKSCLDVRVGREIFSVYARAYEPETVAELFAKASLKINRMLTYATRSAWSRRVTDLIRPTSNSSRGSDGYVSSNLFRQ